MPYGIWKNMEKSAASQYSLTMFFPQNGPLLPHQNRSWAIFTSDWVTTKVAASGLKWPPIPHSCSHHRCAQPWRGQSPRKSHGTDWRPRAVRILKRKSKANLPAFGCDCIFAHVRKSWKTGRNERLKRFNHCGIETAVKYFGGVTEGWASGTGNGVTKSCNMNKMCLCMWVTYRTSWLYHSVHLH